MNGDFRVAVDAGNSSIKFAMSPTQTNHTGDPSNLNVKRLSLAIDQWPESLSTYFASLLPPRQRVHWRLASVNSVACEQLTPWISTNRPNDSQRQIVRSDIGIEANVRYPQRVGIDRLLAARSAFQLAGKRTAIAIDAGTTVTVDVVDESGVFRGGAILPGLGLQLRSLHEATDKLPRLLPADDLVNLEIPGRDTEAAMQLGVARGTVGAIDSLVDAMKGQFEVAKIYLTGGDADRLSPAMRCRHEVISDLPLRGLYLLEIKDEFDK